jgi:bis(5'-adenosyl)-triphosphatase
MTEIVFGVYPIPSSQIFLLRKNVFGMVNHKPFIPGHVLLCTRRIVPRLEELNEEETLDLFTTAQEVCQRLESISQLNYEMTIQNGEEAGQTVKHLHMHLVPKHKNPGI